MQSVGLPGRETAAVGLADVIKWSCCFSGERGRKCKTIAVSLQINPLFLLLVLIQMEDVAAHFTGKSKEKDRDKRREPLFAFANSLNAIRDTVRGSPPLRC